MKEIGIGIKAENLFEKQASDDSLVEAIKEVRSYLQRLRADDR